MLGLEVRDVCLRGERIWIWTAQIVGVEAWGSIPGRQFNVIEADVIGIGAISIGLGSATSVEGRQTFFIVRIRE
jgi:hypothetical protein